MLNVLRDRHLSPATLRSAPAPAGKTYCIAFLRVPVRRTRHNMAKNSKDSDVRTPETFDGATGAPDPTPRRIDLSTLRDVRLELAYLYRQIDAGKIESSDGSRRAYILRQIHDVIVTAEIERRIEELENRTALSGRLGSPAARALN